ncbi:MAG: peptidoglycan-binding protein [Ignavibacteriaceae bacterium]|jgi:predicted chitinase|nr:peptidoglycan-binding protein [Ignavibacteriaceae bacterium]
MEVLKMGSKGTKVKDLQKRLKELGFNPGAIDGDFGPAVKAALIAFQKSKGLLADGVAGPRTLGGLKLVKDSKLPSVVHKVTTTMVSKMFPFAPVDNIKKYLPFVLDALEEENLGDKKMVLMALATIRAETGRFLPIDEGKSKYNTSPGGHPFDLYDKRRDLGNGAKGDGDKYKGRGFIQLTGKANYTQYSKSLRLGNKLVNNPELANDPKIAARILARFLKDKERRIKEALLDNDLRLARKLINGGSHGLDDFKDAYNIGDGLLA